MRLWHKDLIDVLPRKQLIAQWRECCAIASNIAKNGTPNHILVNVMLDYGSYNFIIYTNMILKEMHRRKYKINETSYLNFCKNMEVASQYFSQDDIPSVSKEIYKDWHNRRYLKQCYYNLQEKYDRGMITSNEFQLIEDKYESLMLDEIVN